MQDFSVRDKCRRCSRRCSREREAPLDNSVPGRTRWLVGRAPARIGSQVDVIYHRGSLAHWLARTDEASLCVLHLQCNADASCIRHSMNTIRSTQRRDVPAGSSKSPEHPRNLGFAALLLNGAEGRVASRKRGGRRRISGEIGLEACRHRPERTGRLHVAIAPLCISNGIPHVPCRIEIRDWCANA